eukprot:gnl/MRDRNA2_/MRDRNA2_87980_c0_seq1.p1 gnl/MRDRNA2_/MRDRNA2_87980_c0~~gnl/MRDRNA2_/MRDRNA2_87980_c0_seq1.p1  ORF type:complete len:359 (+),score=85.07 gnl/MRDRNA2_/MRDRNA2_87980_c0_seq1:29-1105(+)
MMILMPPERNEPLLPEAELFSQLLTNGQLPELGSQRQGSTAEEQDEDMLLAIRLSQEQAEGESRRQMDAVADDEMESLLLAMRLSEESNRADGIAQHSLHRSNRSSEPSGHQQRHRGDYLRYSFGAFSRTQMQPIASLVNDPLAIAIREEFLERRGSREQRSRAPAFPRRSDANRSTSSTPTNHSNQSEERRRLAQQRAENLLATEAEQRIQLQQTFFALMAQGQPAPEQLQAEQQSHEHRRRRIEQLRRSPQVTVQSRGTSTEQLRDRTRTAAENVRREARARSEQLRWAEQQRANRSTSVAEGQREVGECPICLEPISDDSSPKFLACGHGFHDFCISRWLQSRPQCPLCRMPHTT